MRYINRMKANVVQTKIRYLYLWLVCSLLTFPAVAQQIQPLQLTTQLIPPYSLNLADYASEGNEKIRVIVLQRDLSRPEYQVRLVLRVELNGKTILQTAPSFQPPPITLEPGTPTILSGADLAAYVDSRNLIFIGLDRNQYEKTKTLPEGSYTFCFTAYDYRRQDVAVSNAGCALYFLSKNEPPLINTPACGSRVTARDPQQIIFSWLPRNTASPTSAANTEYEFSLYENRIKGRNINNVVQTSTPIFTTRTDFTQLVYGLSEPMLIDSMEYVWRVRAIDKEGKDAFRNNGYSEVCSFLYGGNKATFTLGQVQNFRVEAQTYRRAQMSWTVDAAQFDSYRIEYKKKGDGYEWNRIEEKGTEEKDSAYVKVFDLAANTEYEARIQGKKEGFMGPYSAITTFKTPERVAVQCGDSTSQTAQQLGEPLRNLLVNESITARSLDITLTEVRAANGQDGYYSGEGRVAVGFLAGASFGVKFENVYVNENREVTRGTIYFLTMPIEEWVDQTLANQAARDSVRTLSKQQEENQEKYADYEFSDKIALYDNIAIADIQVGSDGKVTLVDEKGKAYTARTQEISQKLDKPLIVEDKNGDQWIVENGKDPVKVLGGGLPEVNTSGIGAKELNIVKKALKELRQEYNSERITLLEKEAATKIQTADQLLKNQWSTGASQTTEIDPSATLEIIQTDMPLEDTEKDRAISKYKLAEYELNTAIVIYWFSRDSNTRKDYRYITAALSMHETTAASYLEQQLKEGRPEAELIAETKEALKSLVKQVIQDYIYK
ncbi:fibronectin type III domain-containing protein [Cytophagaceae bacterium DM2B3-1]|uniref:Fibronectin type III domain-containing protein n=1 Tax=Xanthocytophaga flava TaxID=3048013 RepID=A0ABT7CWK2_9BACT|nr:fibronectin type III domain-containing protein [Xanthocytophaga flavus]MDJ1498134.1 fibronectin type III domain-containing protein [Xanthocytophaga flavus]